MSETKSKNYAPEDYKGPSEFCHLHNHTVFSALDGVATPEQYAEECQKRGYPAMSATEHGHMASVPDMYLAFKKHGIKYISGCEVYYNDWEPKRRQLADSGTSLKNLDNPELSARVRRNRHLTILAKNETGFHNLIKLTTQAYETGLWMRRNRIWFDKLCEFKEGLIVLSGCLNGPICHELRMNELADKEGKVVWSRDKRKCIQDAVDYVKKFRDVFGEDYYIELQMPGIPEDDWVFRSLIAIADKFKIEPVLCNDCHYLRRRDFKLQKVMMAIDQGEHVDSPNLFHVNSDEQYMKTRGELWSRFKSNDYSKGMDDGLFETMCDNTLVIAEKCQELEMDATPKIPEIDDADRQLIFAVDSELARRNLKNSKRKFMIDGQEVTYTQQAAIELERFISKGFASYFLITKDLVNYGKQRGWPFSPRGSAGGSLVCFLLGIHVLDPCLWGLSFDRFLSPSRGGYMLNIRMPSDEKR